MGRTDGRENPPWVRLNRTRYRVLRVLVSVFEEKPGEWLTAIDIAERVDDLLPPSSYPALEWLIKLEWLEWAWDTGEGSGRRRYRLMPTAIEDARAALSRYESGRARSASTGVQPRPGTA